MKPKSGCFFYEYSGMFPALDGVLGIGLLVVEALDVLLTREFDPALLDN